ncbi:MAG TPA: hypothetical protein PLD23_12430 [Armatimonadota bacterium]|nr:hypothetical protein [Armatimonadota bacterium]HQK94309.1 hypothetical protein [Armatimonadota bacterium]
MRVAVLLCCVVLVLSLVTASVVGCKGGNASTDPNAKEASRQKALKQQDEMKNMMNNMKKQGVSQPNEGAAQGG